MNVTSLCRLFVFLTPWTASEINNRARHLRELGFLGQSDHGRRSPVLDPDTAATLLIGLSVGTTVARCHEGVLSHRPMLPVRKRPGFFGNQTFGDALAHILADPTDSLKVERVLICKTWPEGIIEWGSDKDIKRAIYRDAEFPNLGYGFHVREDVDISGALLRQVARDLVDKDDDEPA